MDLNKIICPYLYKVDIIENQTMLNDYLIRIGVSYVQE